MSSGSSLAMLLAQGARDASVAPASWYANPIWWGVALLGLVLLGVIFALGIEAGREEEAAPGPPEDEGS